MAWVGITCVARGYSSGSDSCGTLLLNASKQPREEEQRAAREEEQRAILYLEMELFPAIKSSILLLR